MWGLKAWRRRRILNRYALPEAEWHKVLTELPVLSGLNSGERNRLGDLATLFLHEKSLEGAGDWSLDEAIRLWIAALACLPILNLGLDYYRGWVSVIVYPGGFLAHHEYLDEAGVVHDLHEPLMGEAWERGPVILSWEDIQNTSADLDGSNVVIHEMAHKLDMLTGDANGLPPLHPGMKIDAWSKAFTAAYRDFCRRVEAGQETAFDAYAAESPGEFFAVMSESFFELPGSLQRVYPHIYRQLCDFYRQDPLRRLPLSSHEREGLFRS